MGMIQRISFVGTCDKLHDLPVRMILCFVNKDVSKEKRSTLTVTVKDTKYGKVLAEKHFDVTGNLEMEEGTPDEFRMAARNFIEVHYPKVTLSAPAEHEAILPDRNEPVIN